MTVVARVGEEVVAAHLSIPRAAADPAAFPSDDMCGVLSNAGWWGPGVRVRLDTVWYIDFPPETKNHARPAAHVKAPKAPRQRAAPQMGTRNLLEQKGPQAVADWMGQQRALLITDTTMRDAHQSLLATRMRTYDMLAVAEGYAKNHPDIFSMEVWGGATFDVCLRFLHESPWTRLRELRKAVPNILFQMLLRGSNAVGYKAYPDNLIEKFVEKSWENGVDIFRIFDSLNWVKAMEPSINYVRNKTGGIAEAAISYTGDILNTNQTKYNLKYYNK